LQRKEDCIFCQIVAGEAPASCVYEDEHTVAFADRYPASPGHILVIPKEHYRDITTLPDHLAGRVMQTTVRVARAVDEALEPEGINLVQSNREAARQSVMHFHMHIIPRYLHWQDDDDISIGWRALDAQREELNRCVREVICQIK